VIVLSPLIAVALAEEVELGVGRAALIQLDPPPTAVSVTRSKVADVRAAPPALLVIGRAPGTTSLTVTQAGQPVPIEIVVDEDPMKDPTGIGVLPAGPRVVVAPGSGAICRLPFAPTGITRMETGLLSVQSFSAPPSGAAPDSWYWIQSDLVGAFDVVFERSRGLPLIVTIATSGEPAVPSGCFAPEFTVTVPVGGEVSIPVGRAIAGVLVGHPSLAGATADGRSVKIRGLAAGRTSVLVRSESGEPWLRTVVVVPPPE
jgi:Flp pilus assembly secretin CpaC